ncbi:MAG: tRNA (adenosine(37)-N6)-dimethylallyltransferase MiaA [Bacteroidetes bacterium]|nr:tRNA (adenosine(37)-N6)-dimethylallyltransferase MiaA [Bacteroidota bacterium]
MPWIITVEGPTAVGKTAFAIALAKAFDTAVVSADARQCYREMRIGVARPSPEELAQVPHFFIADRSLHEPLTAGSFEREALALLADLHREHRVVVVAGGSGLYVQSLLEGLDRFPPVPDHVRSETRALFEHGGLEALQAALKLEDPVYAAQVDLQNPHRLMRALEVCRAAGRPYSSFRLQRLAARPFQTLRFVLQRDREELYRRIETRVDRMMAEGLEAEARGLFALRRLSPLDTVGYRELFQYVEGLFSLEQAVNEIKKNTRRYAKRQQTWLRGQNGLIPVDPDDPAAAIAYLRGHSTVDWPLGPPTP